MMLSRVEKADTSIMRVERGTWKFVMSASTTLNSYPGRMKRLVFSRSRGIRHCLSESQALSRLLTLVVPTAITRPF